MIHYALRCTPASHEFDGWFRSGADFDRQAGSALVSCPVCGSTRVEKALMRPAVSGVGEANASPAGSTPVASVPHAGGPTPAEFGQLMRRLQAMSREVRAKADYVGGRFAEEARRIHYGETAERQIYGEATRDEVEKLADDGIPAMPLPPLPEDAH